MLEIIYRIYEVADEETAIQNIAKDETFGLYSSISRARNNELLMDCIICDSRDQFKQIIKDTWGKNTAFRYSSKMQPGDIYCIIIGEHCYNPEKYFNKIEFKCDWCGSEVNTYYGRPITFSESDIKYDMYNIQDYSKKHFCSHQCKDAFKLSERKHLKPDEEQEYYIQKDMFTEDIAGYVYLITKKSTGEFYVGQTAYCPVFRWGQHLKTERFPISKIEDYAFEVLEIVPKSDNILEHEKHWIQTLYNQYPDKSLNIACTKGCEK